MPRPESLQGFGLFDGLTEAQAVAVAQAGREVTFPAGQVIFHEGHTALGCWLIRTGQVALTASVPGVAPVVVQTLGAGDVLGWSWLTEPRRWLFTATAREDVAALELDTDQIRVLADQDPALGYVLTQGLLGAALARLQSTRARLLDVYRSPRDR